MVFERMPMLRAMLFSEYWMGSTDGIHVVAGGIAVRHSRCQPAGRCSPGPAVRIWLPIICTPSIKFAEALPTPVANANPRFGRKCRG